MRYKHLASRIFGVPLLIERNKLDMILYGLSDRLKLKVEPPKQQQYGPGDSGNARKSYFVTNDGIGVINILGPLVKRSSGDFGSGGPTTYGEIENEFMDAATDPAIQGIMLCIDSPGGEVTGAFELADAIAGQRGSKPIMACVDGDAFSAAYALASAADGIVLTKSGGVGSIGVYMLHIDESKMDEQYGVKPTFIFAGAHKVDGNPFEPLSEAVKARFQAMIDSTYEMFVGTVAKNRNMPLLNVKGTEAATFYGQDGVTAGLADQLGTLDDAFKVLRSKINEKRQNMENDVKTVAEASAEATQKTANELSEVVTACITAKQPELAMKLAGEAAKTGKVPSMESVRSQLQELRVAEDAKTQLNTQTLPEASATMTGRMDLGASLLVQECEKRSKK